MGKRDVQDGVTETLLNRITWEKRERSSNKQKKWNQNRFSPGDQHICPYPNIKGISPWTLKLRGTCQLQGDSELIQKHSCEPQFATYRTWVKPVMTQPKIWTVGTNNVSLWEFKIICHWRSPTSEMSLHLVKLCDPPGLSGGRADSEARLWASCR